ncbi:sulfite exporter TauE/SafE family protein [Luteibacter yeojuensis]|uniref:Probable membrane transporter protein n=1 Tax=Luteibacter yeojuensis TaxID=345309 RepID=A0A7X5QWA8_9GAMM|nr:sulfite exporter TauE/SafE family protein [Luteibacter yeojuensis]NID16514.1 sulfite exporter TauE/SafE family protein [Luteibacter yeojuensis]
MFFALLFLTSLAAFALSTVSGGGAGLLLLPVLGVGLATAQVPVALSVGSTISSAARLGLFIRHIEWRVVRWFVPLSLPGAFVGVWLLDRMSPLYLEAVLGLFLLGNLPMLFRRQREMDAKPGRPGTLLVLGLVAGFVSGLTGAVGLLFNRFYLRHGLSRQQVVATRAANEILLHLTKLVLYGAFGLFGANALIAGTVTGAAAIAAAFGVRKVLPRVGEITFRRLGYTAMVVAGAVMTVNAGSGLVAKHGISVASRRVPQGLDLSFNGFGGWVGVELRHNELPEIEYVVAFDTLPEAKRAVAAPLIEGAERVIVEAVLSWRSLAYELHVYRDGVLEKYEM